MMITGCCLRILNLCRICAIRPDLGFGLGTGGLNPVLESLGYPMQGESVGCLCIMVQTIVGRSTEE